MGHHALGTDLKLHLGVLVQSYDNSRRSTTGDVAEILESKYGVMQAFWDTHGQQTADDLVRNLNDYLGGLLSRNTPSQDIFNGSMSRTQARFKKFLSSKQAERVGIPGTPTKAALKGVNHRLAHPYRKSNPRRPSFIDSGLYQASFRAWISGF